MPVDLMLSAEAKLRHLPAPPIVIGLLAFFLLLALMFALLMFGKGRPHT
jgi:hypothetical protein